MPDLLDIRTWSILQWVLVVLAAGFIGQFGKSFAQFIMAKVKAGRDAGIKTAILPVPAEGGKMTPEAPSLPTVKGDLTSPPESSDDPAHDVSSAKDIASGQSAPPVMDKKALKAILKQKKKAGKGSNY
ncbi:MAG TPA: hypothetical protein DCG53_13920 [Syntrophus sp. (in: bacteria)]|jgi:hypothetical protein|nr:hypothetical protein [Syntrophus sp. (in: bacteria)]